MEIISYVGASRAMRRERKSFHFPKISFVRRTPRALKIRQVQASADALAKPITTVSRALNPFRFFKPSLYVRLLPFVALAVLIPLTVFQVADYLESHTGPLPLADLGDSEVNFLNEAMARFAIEQTDDHFDENGNVLLEDGTVLSPLSAGVGQAVTYAQYTVKSGDAISTIARRFGLGNISTLIAINNIDNVRTLRAGQKLKIPSMDGMIHTVKKGESLASVASAYKVSVRLLADTNDLASESLAVGQELFIPGAKMDAVSLKKAMGELFSYPIKAAWRLTSRFGPRADPFTGVRKSHTGIDMACPRGTPIYAAMSGKVIYSGWSNVFGNYVIINHGNGYQSLYGHMDKIIAKTGQSVAQGTKIGLVGSTGYSTGPHLHFTVYKNGKLVDPLTLLK